MEEEEEPHVNYDFPIRESNDLSPMKNINPTALTKFHGFSSKDSNTFIFEFEVVC